MFVHHFREVTVMKTTGYRVPVPQRPSLRNPLCPNNSWLLLHLHNYTAESPQTQVCQPAVTAHSPISSSSAMGNLGYLNSPIRSRWNSFPCNDTPELVPCSCLAEWGWKCLFPLSLFSESGWRSAQGAMLWPFIGDLPLPQPQPVLRLRRKGNFKVLMMGLLVIWGVQTFLFQCFFCAEYSFIQLFFFNHKYIYLMHAGLPIRPYFLMS